MDGGFRGLFGTLSWVLGLNGLWNCVFEDFSGTGEVSWALFGGLSVLVLSGLGVFAFIEKESGRSEEGYSGEKEKGSRREQGKERARRENLWAGDWRQKADGRPLQGEEGSGDVWRAIGGEKKEKKMLEKEKD